MSVSLSEVPAVGTDVIVRLHKGGDLVGSIGETYSPEVYLPLRVLGQQLLIPLGDVQGVRRG